MNRINKEAGTNITVYLYFHEVSLYKQHWWQCDGPCKKRWPEFGMVRRSQIVAPGPEDIWWAKHSTECGGTLVNICNSRKRTIPAIENVKPKEDIHKYIPTEKQEKVIRNILEATSKSVSNGNINRNKDTVILKGKKIFLFSNSNGTRELVEIDMISTSTSKYKKHTEKWFCSICHEEIVSDEYVVHAEEWGKRYLEKWAGNERIDCFTCDRSVLKREFGSHLDFCSVSFKTVPNHVVITYKNEVKYICLWCLLKKKLCHGIS